MFWVKLKPNRKGKIKRFDAIKLKLIIAIAEHSLLQDPPRFAPLLRNGTSAKHEVFPRRVRLSWVEVHLKTV